MKSLGLAGRILKALGPGLLSRLKRRFFPRQVLFIGDYSYGDPKVICYKGLKSPVVRIGKYCSIAANVTFLQNEIHPYNRISTFPFRARLMLAGAYTDGYPDSKGDTIVGNDVWIGYGATIMSGVIIGDGAIIGAGAIIKSNIPPYAIVIGNPGQIVRYRFDDATIIKLLDLQWWNWSEEEIRANIYFLNSPVEGNPLFKE